MDRRVLALSFVLGVLLVGGGVLTALPAAAQSSDATETSLEAALGTVDSLRQAGDFEAARDRLQSLREEHPGEVEVLWRLAYTQSNLGRMTDDQDQRAAYYKESLEAAQSAVAADSMSAHAHLSLAVAEGRVALDAGTKERIQRSRAIKEHADRAIELDSALAGAYHVRGRWHREVADLGFFQRVIVKTVYGGLPDASFERSVRDLQRATELETAVHHHLELGKTYRKMDRTEDARQELETALNIDSSDPLAPIYKKEARKLLDDLG